jgi:hypothetical protein
MRRLIGASLLLAILVGLPELVDAQAPAKKDNQGAPKDSSTLHSGDFSGTLKSTPGSDRTFVLTVETKTLQPNGRPGNLARGNQALNRVVQLQNQLQQQINRATSTRNPQQQVQALQQAQRLTIQVQVAAAQLNNAAGAMGPDGAPPGYKWAIAKQDVEFQTTEEVKVRTLNLPEQFDDKGNVKKYTKEELAELKGKDKNLPGYESSVEKLESGQKMRVTLVPHKKPAADKEKDKDVEKNDKEKNKDKDIDPEKKMQVKLIVITQDAPSGAGSAAQPKKKK